MKLSILLVDDNPKTDLLPEKTILNGIEINVILAHSGMDALEKMDKNKPDIILLDIKMPETNGIEFCRRVRCSERFAHIPIIIVSVKRDEEVIEMAFAAGCNEFLIKPLKRNELLAKVSSYLV